RVAEDQRGQDSAPRASRREESRLTRSNLIRGLAWAGLAILCWTPLFSVAKRTLPYIDAFALGTLRYAIGVVLFILLLSAVEGRAALRFDGRLLMASAFGVIGITG